jgi:hypothetical protein
MALHTDKMSGGITRAAYMRVQEKEAVRRR